MLRVAGPLIALRVSVILIGLVDTLMAGRIGPGSIAAVGAVGAVAFLAIGFGMGVLLALEPVAGSAYGRGEMDRVRAARSAGRQLALGLGALCVVVTTAAPDLLLALGQPEELEGDYRAYATLYAWALVPALLYHADAALLTARARTGPLLAAALGINAVNIGANLWFSSGGWFLPALGIRGIALASLLAYAAGAALLWLVLRALPEHQGRGDAAAIAAARRDVLRIGLPVGAQITLEGGGFSVVTVLMGYFGSTVQGAHQVALTLIALPFMISLGMGGAASGLIAQAAGRGAWSEVRAWGWTAFGLAAIVASVSALLLFHFAPLLAGGFVRDSEVLVQTVALLHVAAFFQVSDALQATGFAVLRGLADTRVPLRFNVLAYYGLGLPLGAWAAFAWDVGPAALWWGLSGALLIVAGLLMARFRSLTHPTREEALSEAFGRAGGVPSA